MYMYMYVSVLGPLWDTGDTLFALVCLAWVLKEGAVKFLAPSLMEGAVSGASNLELTNIAVPSS